MSLFRKKSWEIRSQKSDESADRLVNPGCGWYRPYIFRQEEPVDDKYLESVIVPDETLCLIEIALYHYREGGIDLEGRERIRQIMSFFSDHDKDIMLRFTYDLEGKALEREPLRMEIVFSHMASVSELIEPWRDRVLLMQGLFTGNWGEMHGSRFMTEHLMRELYDYFRAEFGRDMYLAVRRPSYLRLLSGEALRDPYLTIYDDAILSSTTDLGTFGASEEWTGEWRRDRELDFIEKECAHRPVGGEVVRAQHAPEGDVSDGEIMRSLSQMRLSYLNSQYDKRVLDRWKRLPAGRGAAEGVKTLYDDISLRLGYRYVYDRAQIETGRRGDTHLRIMIANRGFAPATESSAAVLCVGDREYRLGISSSALEPGRSSGIIFPLVEELPPGEYPVRLRLERERDGRTIHFANRGAGELDAIPIGTLTRR